MNKERLAGNMTPKLILIIIETGETFEKGKLNFIISNNLIN